MYRSCHANMGDKYTVLSALTGIGVPIGQIQRGRFECRRENNVKEDFRDTCCKVNCQDLT